MSERSARKVVRKARPSPVSADGRKKQKKRRKAPKSILAWTAAALTVFFLILTSVYASDVQVTSRFRFLYNSPSNTIFVLSVLSSFTGFFLTATIAATFETVQWLLISRDEGLRASKLLSLEAGTSLIGLLYLTLGRGVSWRSGTRLWAIVRLASIVLVPLVGILIMSEYSAYLLRSSSLTV